MVYRDVVPVLASSYHGSSPTSSLDPSGGHSVLGGGMDYVPEDEQPDDDKHCTKIKPDGKRCAGWAGDDGVCNGHRLQEWKLTAK